jgi:hypothetical protein
VNRVVGKVGFGLLLNLENQFVSIPAPDTLNQNFTLCAWVQPTSDQAYFEASNQTPVRGTGLRFVVEPTSVGGVGLSVGLNGISVVVAAPQGFFVLLTWNASIPLTARWTHVCVAFDVYGPLLYVNAQPLVQGLVAPISSSISVSNIGGNTQFYQGIVDQVKVFAARLTVVGVRQLYQTERTFGFKTSHPFVEPHFHYRCSSWLSLRRGIWLRNARLSARHERLDFQCASNHVARWGDRIRVAVFCWKPGIDF